MGENEQIKAVLKRIIFQKPETGFIIGSFQRAEVFDAPEDTFQDDLPFSGLGNIINPQVGMEYLLTGEWGESPQYGKQFKIKSFSTLLPADPNGIYKYIVRICKFVGPTIGARLVETYGAETLNMMRTEPAKIAREIAGINYDRAIEIQGTLIENEATESVIVELEAMLDIPGMRKALPGELIKKFGSNAAEAVKQNPYILIQFSGISFILADRVAMKLGYARDGIERKKAAAMHCVDQDGVLRGDVWVHESVLEAEMKELIQVNDLMAGVAALVECEKLVEDNGHFALPRRAYDEAYIAEKVTEFVMLGRGMVAA